MMGMFGPRKLNAVFGIKLFDLGCMIFHLLAASQPAIMLTKLQCIIVRCRVNA